MSEAVRFDAANLCPEHVSWRALRLSLFRIPRSLFLRNTLPLHPKVLLSTPPIPRTSFSWTLSRAWHLSSGKPPTVCLESIKCYRYRTVPYRLEDDTNCFSASVEASSMNQTYL